MSRAGLSAFVFVMCISLSGATAQPLPWQQARAVSADTNQVELHSVTGKPGSNEGTVETVSRYITDVGSYVHVQTIAPAMDVAGSSLYWVWSGSQSALNTVYGGLISTVSSLSGTITASVYWPASTLEEFVLKLHDGTFDEFNRLVGEAGFSIVSVELGISVVPDLSVEFEHVRNLNDIETAAVRAQIDDYLTRTTTGLGHLESAILRNLVNVGGYTGESDALNGIVVNLFPRQSAVLDFHVFGNEERRPKQILKSIELAAQSGGDGEMLEDRLTRMETAIRNLNADGN